MRRRKLPKREAQKIHAVRAARKRYNLNLTGADLQRIVMEIQAGNSTCLGKRSIRTGVHILEYANKEIKVVYDKNRKSIVTFLNIN